MRCRKAIALAFCFLALPACQTAGKSSFLGAGVGGVIGGGIGAAAGHAQGKAGPGAAIGAAVGAAVGGLAGWLEHKNRGNGKNQSQSPFQSNGEAPALTMPEVRRVWVPSRIEGNKFIDAHWIYLIDRQSTWRLDDKDNNTKRALHDK